MVNGLCLSVDGESNVKISPCQDGKEDMQWRMNNKGKVMSNTVLI